MHSAVMSSSLASVQSMNLSACGCRHHKEGEIYRDICPGAVQERTLLCAHSSRWTLMAAINALVEAKVLSKNLAAQIQRFLERNYMFETDSRIASTYELCRTTGTNEFRRKRCVELGFDIPIGELTPQRVNREAKSLQKRTGKYLILLREWLVKSLQGALNDSVLAISPEEVAALTEAMTLALRDGYKL